MRSILDISQASRRSVCVPFVRHPLISTFPSLSSQSLHTFTCLSVCCVCPVSQGDLLLTAELWPLRGVAIVLVCVAFNSTQDNFGFVLVSRLAFSGSHTINSPLPFSQYPPSVGAAKKRGLMIGSSPLRALIPGTILQYAAQSSTQHHHSVAASHCS